MRIYIGFSRRNMFFSRFLQFIERRPYSHCYVRFTHHVTRQNLILHAAGITIHTLTQENFYKHGNIIIKEYVFDISDLDTIKKILSFTYEQSGSPYGWVQILGMGLVKLATFLGLKIKNPMADERKTMVCSEYCAYVAKLTGKVDLDLDHAEIGGPSWLDKELEKAGIPLAK